MYLGNMEGVGRLRQQESLPGGHMPQWHLKTVECHNKFRVENIQEENTNTKEYPGHGLE
jgi:hypothetical protein